jgi:putative hydroxymethylpyrimidine transport system substrate-binding protein
LSRGLTPRLAAAVLCASAVVTLGLAACGGGDDATTGSASNPQPFTLDLDWYVNPDHAGIYTALERGYFEEAGLDVRPQVPSDPAAPIKQVAAGRADLAVSYEPPWCRSRSPH